MSRFRVASFNAFDKLDAEVRAIRESDVLLGQECPIIPTDNTIRLKYAIRRAGHDTDLTIALRFDVFEVERAEFYLAHYGRAKVTPNRGTFVVWARHIETGQTLAFAVEHRINRTGTRWIGKGVARAWRWARWRDHAAMTAALVEGIRRTGIPVIGGADFNRVNPPLPHKRARWAALRRIDGVWFLNAPKAPYRLRLLDPTAPRGRWGSDHPYVSATLSLVERTQP